ncbi:MAG: hypothetical protein RL235_559, partial [Chlamydiota bacterium]
MLRFMRLAMFWSFGSSCLETLSDGLFLEKIGASYLPHVYLTVAIAMIAISSVVLYSLKVTNPYRILMIALAMGGLICLASATLITISPPSWFWVVLKIVSRMFFAVMIAISWTFADQYHDLQDAKRVYSLYSAAYFVGTILSGVAISLCLDTIGFPGLLVASAASIALAMGEARGIALKAKAVPDDTVEGVFSSNKDPLPRIFQLIIRSRFAIALLLLSLFIQLLITVTEFNYMDAFDRLVGGYDAEGTKIAEFLGKCRALISFCNILISLFLYSRLVRRTGLSNAVLFTPLFFLALYTGWLFADGMLLAIVGLIAVDGVLFTVEDNCFNLLSNAVPTKLKSKVRIINDSFFEPIGMLLSSLLLLGLSPSSHWLGFVLTLVVLILAAILRTSYPKAILESLQENALHFERTLKGWLTGLTKREQKEAKREIQVALLSTDEEIQSLAMTSLFELKDGAFIGDLLYASERMGTVARIQLLQLFDQSPFNFDPRVIEVIDSWTDPIESPELAKWANFYLAKRGLHHPEKAEDDLDHPDLLSRGSAILTMLRSLANATLEHGALNRTIAKKKLDLMLKSPRIDEISMVLDILSEEGSVDAIEQILPFLSHDSLLVKRSAARALMRLASPEPKAARFAPRILEELEASRDGAFRLHLIDAIGNMADSTTVKELIVTT